MSSSFAEQTKNQRSIFESRSALMKRDYRKLGRFLKERRLRAGLRQVDVARKIHCHNQFISNIERGVCGAPLKILKSMMKIYSVNLEEIIKLIIAEQEVFLKKYLGEKR
jgi:transcriptional regulator with XRE-family HTH domain